MPGIVIKQHENPRCRPANNRRSARIARRVWWVGRGRPRRRSRLVFGTCPRRSQ